MSAKLNSVAEIAFSLATKFLQPPKSQLDIHRGIETATYTGPLSPRSAAIALSTSVRL